MDNDIWEGADLIDGCSRAELIADCTLIDVTDSAAAHGIKINTCIHEELYHNLFNFGTEEQVEKDLDKFLTVVARKLREQSDQSQFNMLYANCAFIVHCGPGDNAEPVLTILYSKDL